MEQLEFFVVPSPCIGICTVDEKGYCKGCMRKREERFNWLTFSPSEQIHIIKLCRQRYYRKHKGSHNENDVTASQLGAQQELF